MLELPYVVVLSQRNINLPLCYVVRRDDVIVTSLDLHYSDRVLTAGHYSKLYNLAYHQVL